jgi:predicted RNA-binding protein with TRAM domain
VSQRILLHKRCNRKVKEGMNETRPVKVGDVLNVRIEAVGEKGDGIAKKDGFVLFVPNTSEGDEVQVRVTKVLRRVGFAEVVGAGEPVPKAQTAPPRESKPAVREQDTEDFGEGTEEEPVHDTEDFKEEEAGDDDDFADEGEDSKSHG